MLFAQPERIKIHIQEVGIDSCGQAYSERYQTWRVQIRIKRGDEQLVVKETDVQDPLDQPGHNSMTRYLDKTLNDVTKPNDDHVKEIDRYRKKLFQSLDLDEPLQQLHFRNKKVEIQICEMEQRQNDHQDSATSPRKSFHSIHWELLEDLSTWVCRDDRIGLGPASVTVWRFVRKIREKPQLQPRERQTPQDGHVKSCNILLVVARKNVHGSKDVHGEDLVDYFNPTSVLRAILEAKGELECRQPHQRIHLEVVRPGGYDELDRHLSKGGFQVVHFDVHGTVSSNSDAYLIFNKYDSYNHRLGTNEISASKIAQLLLKHNIRCAVLSSCKTAVADAKGSANLSWSFLQEGIACTLAISFNIPDTMVKIFYRRFYHEIIVGRKEFADAAAIARDELRKDPKRWSYENQDWMPLQDWFIPKVYSNGTPWYMDRNPNLNSALPVWLISPENLWIVSLLVFTFSLIADLPSWSPLVHVVKLLMDLDDQASVTLRRWSSVLAFSCSLAIYLGPRWRKRRSLQRLELINSDRQNILRVESDLCQSQNDKIFLHTFNDANNTAQTLLDGLSDVWCRTHFVQHRVIIKADWFIQPFQWDRFGEIDVRWIPRSLRHSLCLWIHESSPGLKHLLHGGRDASSVVLVTNIKALFPTEKEKAYHTIAQRRFYRWIEKYYGADEKSMDGKHKPRYLVLIGERRADSSTQQWFQETLGKCQALTSTVLTEYTDPNEFSHRLEPSVLGRSSL